MKKLLNTKIKDVKAVTLIALVVTIVVLIVLAGVLVSLTLGDNGIFKRAKKAKEDYANAQGYEETEIAKLSNEIEKYSRIDNSRSNGFTVTTLWQYDSTVSGDDVNSGRKTGEITLSQPITNFDEIVFLGQYYSEGDCNQAMEERILVENLTSNPPSNGENSSWKFVIDLSPVGYERRIVFNMNGNNKLNIVNNDQSRLLNIKGIKY